MRFKLIPFLRSVQGQLSLFALLQYFLNCHVCFRKILFIGDSDDQPTRKWSAGWFEQNRRTFCIDIIDSTNTSHVFLIRRLKEHMCSRCTDSAGAVDTFSWMLIDFSFRSLGTGLKEDLPSTNNVLKYCFSAF
jgi:hypothetical protein